MALSRPPRSTPASRPASRAWACRAASVTPAPASTCAAAAVHRPEVGQARGAEDDLAAARHARADHARVAALRHDRRAVRAAGGQHGDDLRGVRRSHDGPRPAAVAPRPVDLEGGAEIVVGQHVGGAEGGGEILHEACRSRQARYRRLGGMTAAMTAPRDHESVFTLEATPIKFGPGAAADAGWELKRLGVTRALLVTDQGVAATGHPERVRRSIEAEGIEVVVYDAVHVEPTDESFQQAADAARDAGVDGFVSVGGGSSIDTAKVADLITTHGGAVMD